MGYIEKLSGGWSRSWATLTDNGNTHSQWNTCVSITGGIHGYFDCSIHSVLSPLLGTEPEEKAFLNESSTRLGEAYQRDVTMGAERGKHLHDAITETMTMFESRDLFNKLDQFEGSASNIQHFLLNYIKQFETILQLVRSTRQRDILLHMDSTKSLIKYFFTHDHLNYARLLPQYISTMHEAERQHPDIWAEFLKVNFCVTKGVG